MPKCRVFQNPDGNVRLMHLNERYRRANETDEEFLARETAKQPELAGLLFADVDATTILADRSKRHAWRLNAGTVIADLTVPDPPHPKQALLDEIASATTIVALRAVLTKVVQG